MIQLPRRSVTRFFIPLIDVLTLLFCIFLLMPLIKATGETEDNGTLDKPSGKRVEQANAKVDNQDFERSRKERIRKLQENLYLRVLEIDADSGGLFTQEADQRRQIRNQQEALKLIGAHRAEGGTRELYYLFLYPRRLTGFPLRSQIEQYETWFRGVAHTTDNPRGES